MLEINVVITLFFIGLFLLSIYLYGRKEGYTKGFDTGYKKATDEYEKVIEKYSEVVDNIENKWKRDYYN